MSGSEFAARNPRAVIESLERAIGCTWREMQRCRRERRMGNQTAPWFREYKTERASHEAETLRVLLNIRRGVE